MNHFRYFHATQPGKTIGDNSVLALVEWLRSFVELAVPENGIEYWADSDIRRTKTYKPGAQAPKLGMREGECDTPVCFVRTGGSEGRIIEIGMREHGGTVRNLCWAKSFGHEAQCWAVAHACSAALESILWSNRVPELVGLAQRLDADASRKRIALLASEPVVIRHGMEVLYVGTESGAVYDERSWDDPHYGQHEVEALVRDWCSVLRARKVPFVLEDREISGVPGQFIVLADSRKASAARRT